MQKLMPGLHVLIVDDDSSVRSLIEAVLSRDGFECSFCADGEKAIRSVRERAWDAIVLDLMMPRVNGFEFLQFLRAERPEMASRVIVATAASEATLQYFDSSSVRALLHKPFDISDLVAAVRECCGISAEPPRRRAEQ